MANLADNSGDAYSNLVQGTGTNSVTFRMPGNVPLAVESVVATVDNAAGGATKAKLTVKDSAGVVIATSTQADRIPAGDTGTATFALRLADRGGAAAVEGRHAGYYWSNDVAAAAVVGPGGGTSYRAAWDFMDHQWGDELLDITDLAHPVVLAAGLYTFSFEVRLITGLSVVGDYAGKVVTAFHTFNTVPAPLFGNMLVTFPMTITQDWVYPQSSSAFSCFMEAGDTFEGGFRTTQATLGALYRGFGDASIVISWLDADDLTA